MPELTSPEILKTLKCSHLLTDLTEPELQEIQALLYPHTFKKGQIITKEGEPTAQLFIVHEGRVEIIKGNIETPEHCFQLSTMSQGQSFGEIAALDASTKRTASVRALTDCVVFSIDASALHALIEKHKSSATLMMRNVAKTLAQRLSSTSEKTVASLERELEQAKLRISMGRFIIYTGLLITLYAIAISGFSHMEGAGDQLSTLVSIPVITIFAISLFTMMWNSGYPLSIYGLTLKGWKKSVLESLLWTLPLLALITLAKWIMLHTIASLSQDPLFMLPSIIQEISTHGLTDSISSLLGFAFAYAIFVPMQELAARGALQSSLQLFLTGRYKTAWAIFISSTSFAATHTHLSMTIALSVLPLGLFWGILYARQKSLVGPILSHIIVGWWAFFVLGLERIA